eukprot:5045467-Amphidinium_carterae.1
MPTTSSQLRAQREWMLHLQAAAPWIVLHSLQGPHRVLLIHLECDSRRALQCCTSSSQCHVRWSAYP